MTVIDKINSINNTIKYLFKFVSESEITKNDFKEYLSTIGALNVSSSQMEKLFVPYVFERNLGEPPKSVIEYFCESELGKNNIANSLLSSQYTVFRIEKVLKNGFSLFNMTNEKQYSVISLTKMTSFRGINSGEFIVARIFEYENEYYLIGIDNIFPQSKLKEAIRYAIIKIVQTPWLVYQDNIDKEKEIQDDIKNMHSIFVKIFGADEFVTTNKYADNVLAVLNNGESTDDFDIENVKKPLKEYKFFKIKELNNNYDNFIENSLGGFSSHSEIYDVGIICDEELGLYSIPFYQTFCNIFNGDEIENSKECIEYFLQNDGISDKILKRVYDKYPNFMKIFNKIFNTKYTFKTLLNTYKSEFLKRKIYSSTSVLYHSSIFSASVDMVEENSKNISNQNQKDFSEIKVGRNEPCPCGSGKKYKNCCLK